MATGTAKRKQQRRAQARAARPPGDDWARRARRAIVVLYLAIAAMYATTIPFGAGPDETAHLRYLEHLAQQHRFPVFDAAHPDPDYEFHQPPLYYLVALPAYLLSPKSPEVAGTVVRFVGIIIGLALVYLTFALGRRLAPDRPWTAVAAAGIVAFLPMHLHLVASIGNDVLAEALAAAALLLLAGALRAGGEYRAGRREAAPPATTAGWLGLFIGLSLLTKSLGVLLLPVAWLGLALAGRGPVRYEWRRVGRDIIVATAVALVISGPWLLRNQLLYGDPLAQRAFLEGFKGLRPSPQSMMARSPSLGVTGYVELVAGWTFASTLGVFGPVTKNNFVFYPWPVYALAAGLALVAAVGFMGYLVRRRATGWQARAWVVFGVFGALLLASFVRFNLDFFQAQARYLFPALPAAALAFVLGLEEFAPPRRRAWVSMGAVALLGALALFGLVLWIIPEFAFP
jgi:hypothetical protein